MEENKYFTPNIEDLYVGYELEIKDKDSGVWNKCTIGKDAIWHQFTHLENLDQALDQLRTPYLTQDQIEEEGWELYAKSIDSWFKYIESPITHTEIQDFYGYKPYSLYLNYGFHDHRLKIKCDFDGGAKFNNSDTLFEGECKDINTLRKINKLLKIK